ncbi:hypothetical protein FCM35_KLT00367 [Carex littledalei]|uniref:Uncharacterized protein n=1 Tax=Carex littledalei TaxID=544730 RepID=A0A833W382_9POAL|nr:hypothetical protein FCM35_KLT00367 [Carex littledalei]
MHGATSRLHASSQQVNFTEEYQIWRHYSAKRDKPLAIPSVTELHEAGVRFKRKRKPRDLFDITFEDGVMEIPALYIDDLHCVLLANVLAFEQTSYGPGEIVSHFVSFLDNLIDARLDVTWLEHRRILINMIRNATEAANFINQLGKWNLVEHNDEYKSLIINVQRYSTSLWPRYRSTLMRDYFVNPWTTISVIAAIIFLGLTFCQTYYTIYSTRVAVLEILVQLHPQNMLFNNICQKLATLKQRRKINGD